MSRSATTDLAAVRIIGPSGRFSGSIEATNSRVPRGTAGKSKAPSVVLTFLLENRGGALFSPIMKKPESGPPSEYPIPAPCAAKAVL
jgi:hypothetical protein